MLLFNLRCIWYAVYVTQRSISSLHCVCGCCGNFFNFRNVFSIGGNQVLQLEDANIVTTESLESYVFLGHDPELSVS